MANYKVIYCLKAVAGGVFIPSLSGLYGVAHYSTDNGLFGGGPPYTVTSHDLDGDPCSCNVRARRCSDDAPVHIYVVDTDINFGSTYIFQVGTSAICVYFDENDERYLGCTCVTPGAPGIFTELPDTICADCVSNNPDPDFYLQAFDCETGFAVVVGGQTQWALESDVTVGTVYWAGPTIGCIKFKNPPSLTYDALLDAGDLTSQSDCTTCQTSHKYIRAFACSDDTPLDFWVLATSVNPLPTIYYARGRCFYFAGQTTTTPPVDPIPPGELEAFIDCVTCLTAHPTGECADCPSYEDAQAIYDTDLIVTVGGCGDTVVVTLSSNHNGTWGGSSGAYSLGLTCGGGDGKHWEMTVTILPDCTIVLRKCNDGETPLGDDYIVASGLNSDNPSCPCTDLDVTVDR